jgi:hypothetical protein
MKIFDPYSLFKNLDQLDKGKLSLKDIIRYMTDHDYFYFEQLIY